MPGLQTETTAVLDADGCRVRVRQMCTYLFLDASASVINIYNTILTTTKKKGNDTTSISYSCIRALDESQTHKQSDKSNSYSHKLLMLQ